MYLFHLLLIKHMFNLYFKKAHHHDIVGDGLYVNCLINVVVLTVLNILVDGGKPV